MAKAKPSKMEEKRGGYASGTTPASRLKPPTAGVPKPQQGATSTTTPRPPSGR